MASAEESSKVGKVSKWVTVIESGEMNVLFHPKYRRYQLDIVSNEETSAFIAAPRNKRIQKHQ